MKLQLVSNGSTGAGNGAPTAVTDGLPIRSGSAGITLSSGLSDTVDEVAILVEAAVSASTVGSVAYVRMWGWFDDAASANKWFPLGTGADADKGKLNEASALGETGSDIIRHVERMSGVRECSRLYAEYGALSNVTRIDVTALARG